MRRETVLLMNVGFMLVLIGATKIRRLPRPGNNPPGPITVGSAAP